MLGVGTGAVVVSPFTQSWGRLFGSHNWKDVDAGVGDRVNVLLLILCS